MLHEQLVYLFAGYTVIWTAIFLYTLQMGGRQRRLEAELELLKETLARKQT